MKKHRKAQLEERMKLARLWDDNGADHALVFATRVGAPLDAQNLTSRAFLPLLESELPRIRFHDHSAVFSPLSTGTCIRE